MSWKTSKAGLSWSEGEYRCDQLEREGELSFALGSLTRTPLDDRRQDVKGYGKLIGKNHQVLLFKDSPQRHTPSENFHTAIARVSKDGTHWTEVENLLTSATSNGSHIASRGLEVLTGRDGKVIRTFFPFLLSFIFLGMGWGGLVF